MTMPDAELIREGEPTAAELIPSDCRQCEIDTLFCMARLWHYLSIALVADLDLAVVLEYIPSVL